MTTLTAQERADQLGHPLLQCPADNPHGAHVYRRIITGRPSSIANYCPGLDFHPTVVRLFALAKDRTRGEGVTARLVGPRAYRAVLAENLLALIAGLDSSTRDDLVVLLVRQGWDLLNTELKS